MSIALVVLVLVVALNLLLTLALVSRVRALQTMVIGSGPEPLPAPGTPVGTFETTTVTGEPLTDTALRTDDATLVGFFTTDCEWCEKAQTALLASPPAVPMIAFVRGSDDDAKARALRSSLERVARVAYTDGEDPAYRAFKPTGFPSLFLIKQGLVTAASHRLADVVS